MHEQGHYNIAKAFARDLRKHFYNNRFSRNNYNQQIENVFSQLNIKYEALQKQYDSETNHCLNKKMQSTWEKKIKQLMADNL